MLFSFKFISTLKKTALVAMIGLFSGTATSGIIQERFNGNWNCTLDGRAITIFIETDERIVDCPPICHTDRFTTARVTDRGNNRQYDARRLFDTDVSTPYLSHVLALGKRPLSQDRNGLVLLLHPGSNSLSGYSRWQGTAYALQCTRS